MDKSHFLDHTTRALPISEHSKAVKLIVKTVWEQSKNGLRMIREQSANSSE